MQIASSKLYYYAVNRLPGKEKALQGKEPPLALTAQPPAGETMEKQIKDQEAGAQAMDQQLELSGRQMKEEKDKLKNLLTCLEISRRIMAGDKVPQADHQYLLKHDPGLYARSISMRFPKNNPYEYKRISKADESSNEWSGVVVGDKSFKELMKGELLVQQAFGAAIDVKA